MDGRNLLYAGISLVVSMVMYVGIPEPLWDMYQFDTERLFPWLYMAGLVLFGVLLRPYGKGGGGNARSGEGVSAWWLDYLLRR